MSRTSPIMARQEVIPTYPKYEGYVTSVVAVGTSAVALPTTNVDYRKGLFIQNIHGSQILYVGGSTIPDVIESPHHYLKETSTVVTQGNLYNTGATKLDWKLSTAGGSTNEYYAVLLSSGGDPSLTEPLIMYGITSSGGTESLLTNGSAGTLNNLEWDWGNTDSLGYNTIYFRFNTGNPHSYRNYLVLLSYASMPSATTAVKIESGKGLFLDLAGNARVWGIANGSSTTTVIQEYI